MKYKVIPVIVGPCLKMCRK